MAKTLILFIALLFTGAASYFSYNNLGKSKAERFKINQLEESINDTQIKINKTEETILLRRADIDTETRRSGTLESDIAALDGEISSAKKQIKDFESQIETQVAEIKQFEDALAELKKFFESMNVNDMEELNDKIKELQGSTIAREKELAETQALVEGANAAVAKLEEQLGAGRNRQMERNRGLQTNTSEAVVMAVNADWGFVVINAGESQGYRGDNSLIVKRGETYIAKLAITSISKNQMVADILPKSVAQGMSVMPGDRVILQSPNR
jgi:septal ring factor EnvC (AmiA/AmiB activator)